VNTSYKLIQVKLYELGKAFPPYVMSQQVHAWFLWLCCFWGFKSVFYLKLYN